LDVSQGGCQSSVIEKSHDDKRETQMSHEKTATCSIPASTTRKLALHSLGDRGFTLIELIVVTAILGVLALLAFPAYDQIKNKAREVTCMTEIRDLERIISAYVIDKGAINPGNWVQLGIATPVDPWGHAYEYKVPFRKDVTFINGDYDLYSNGADGVSAQDIDDANSLDDLVRSGDGGFVGLVSNMLF